jgi:hypothetical protein
MAKDIKLTLNHLLKSHDFGYYRLLRPQTLRYNPSGDVLTAKDQKTYEPDKIKQPKPIKILTKPYQ